MAKLDIMAEMMWINDLTNGQRLYLWIKEIYGQANQGEPKTMVEAKSFLGIHRASHLAQDIRNMDEAEMAVIVQARQILGISKKTYQNNLYVGLAHLLYSNPEYNPQNLEEIISSINTLYSITEVEAIALFKIIVDGLDFIKLNYDRPADDLPSELLVINVVKHTISRILQAHKNQK